VLVLNYIVHCLKGNPTLLHFIAWRATCLRYVLLFECLPAFHLNSYELFCLDNFLDATSLSISATHQTSKKSRYWTGRKSGELSCITWGTGWTHLENETDFNLFLGFCAVDLHGFWRCRKLQFENHIILVQFWMSQFVVPKQQVLVEIWLYDSELTYVDQSYLSRRCYCSPSAEIILPWSIPSLYL